MGTKRETLTPWRTLCVLFANNGKCAYCDHQEATEVEHVIPAAQYGSNRLENLVPACYWCNRSKANKTPPEWMVSLDLRDRWIGALRRGGIPQGEGGIPSLRTMYEKIHGETLELLDALDTVHTEILNKPRQVWFQRTYWHLPQRNGAAIRSARRNDVEMVEKAKAEGWPERELTRPRLTFSAIMDSFMT